MQLETAKQILDACLMYRESLEGDSEQAELDAGLELRDRALQAVREASESDLYIRNLIDLYSKT